MRCLFDIICSCKGSHVYLPADHGGKHTNHCNRISEIFSFNGKNHGIKYMHLDYAGMFKWYIKADGANQVCKYNVFRKKWFGSSLQ